MAERGRPTVWNPDLEEQILGLISAGNSERVSAEHSGIGYSTFREHREADANFAARCQRARAACIVNATRELMETDDPVRAKTRLHLLACKDPDEWSAEQRVRHSGQIGCMEALATPVSDDANAGG